MTNTKSNIKFMDDKVKLIVEQGIVTHLPVVIEQNAWLNSDEKKTKKANEI